MKDLLRFRFTGIGHLEGIDTKEEGVSALIRVVHPSFDVDNIGLEEVTLHCTIDKPEWILLLRKLEKKIQEDHCVIVKFQVAYSHFGFCHYGIGDDPKQLVQFHTKLVRIDGWYLDGHWTNTGDPVDAISTFDKAA